MAFILSSPTSTSETTSLASSPRIASISIVKLDDDEHETPNTSLVTRDRNGTSEKQQKTASGVNSPRTEPLSPLSQAQSDIYTVTTDIHPEPSLFATEATQTRIYVSASSSSSTSSLSTTPSSNSSASRKSSNAGSVGHISSVRAPWPVVFDDSVASMSTSSSTVTTTTPARFTAKEKGKAPDHSGRDWARSLDEKEHRRGRSLGDEKEHRRTRSTGETELKSSMKKRSRRTVRDDDDRCTRHKTIQEDGFSRDFLLLVALCVGFACAGILVARPAILALNGGDGFELYDD